MKPKRTATYWIASNLIFALSCSQNKQIPFDGVKPSSKAVSLKTDSTLGHQTQATPSATSTSPAASSAAATAQLPLLSDDAVFDFINKRCSTCHGIDAAGAAAPNASFWSFRANELSVAALEINVSAPLLYAVLNRSAFAHLGAQPKPAAMPPAADPDTIAFSKEIVRWFDTKLPIVVSDAVARYPGLRSEKRADILTFQCEKVLTLRQFINRFFLAAFDSPPSQLQLIEIQSKLIAPSLDVPVTKAQRQLVVNLLDEEHYEERFKRAGLSKLAISVSGVSRSELNSALSDAMKDALSKEFEMLLRADWKTSSYDSFFSSPTVMATKETAQFYGCEVPVPRESTAINTLIDKETDAYFSCELKAPRGGFFTTLGFLASRPSSFLVENNNYGRVAGMYFSLFGEGLKAATDGPAGSTEVPALPNCLEQNDLRAFAGAPRGTAAIPLFGAICQSCHIGRNLASGSVLFRPFGPIGQLFDPATLGTEGTDDFALVAAASRPGWTQVHQALPEKIKAVDVEHLRTLLSAALEDPKACLPNDAAGKNPVIVKNVAALAKQLTTNGDQLAAGFARHAQRAFATKQSVTLDVLLDARNEWNKGNRTIKELSKSYFLGEHFSCDSK